MISPIAGSTPTTPSSLYSTPPMISDRPGSLSPISLPPTHAEQNSDSSFSTLQLSPSSRQSIDSLSTKASSEGSSPATLSPPVTRSPSPPSSQSSEQQTRKEKKKHWRPSAEASQETEFIQRTLQHYAKSRDSSGLDDPSVGLSTASPTPTPVTAPVDHSYLLPYAQMAPCYLLPNGQFVFLNPLEWAQMTADTSSAFAQLSLSSRPQQTPILAPSALPVSYQPPAFPSTPYNATSDTIGVSQSTVSVPTHSNLGLGIPTQLMEVPTTYVQPIPAWSYDCRPYFVPQMIEGFVPSSNGRRRVRPGFCLFIFHLPPETVDEELFQLFSQYGTVLSAKVIRDKSTQDSKGYGFVNMATEQQADYAIERLNGSRYKNKYLKVSYKKKKNYSGKSPR